MALHAKLVKLFLLLRRMLLLHNNKFLLAHFFYPTFAVLVTRSLSVRMKGDSTTSTATGEPVESRPSAPSPLSPAPYPLVDIGVNLTHRALIKHWKEVVQRAIDANVDRMLLTGTSIKSSRESIQLAREWSDDNDGKRNLLCTVGIHPHDAKLFHPKAAEAPVEESTSSSSTSSTTCTSKVDAVDTISEMREMITTNRPLVVAVGECGLDYNRNFSSKTDQIHAFREQVKLACELQMPLFVHEREASADTMRIFDQIIADDSIPPLPPVVIHCFTGEASEAMAYIDRGFYIGFTGTICKKERGAHLRNFLPSIPLDRILIETDAPFMSFLKRKKARHSEPSHVVGVAEEISRTMGISLIEVCRTTTKTAEDFFCLPSVS